MTNYSYRSRNASEGMMGAIKSNPEGLLLLAAGCALLLRSGSSSGSGLFGGSQRSNQHDRPSYTSQRSEMEGVADAASERVDRARRYASDAASSVSETAKEYASSIGDYAESAQRKVVEGSEQLMEQARGAVEPAFRKVLQEQPLSLVLLGLAAGAAVASILPRTSLESDTLGPVGEKVAEVASNVRENLGEAASQAGERLKQVADERGLNAEGLKEAAGEVASAFGSAFKGEDQAAASRPGGSASNTGAVPQSGASGHQAGQPAWQNSTATGDKPRGVATSGPGSSSTVSSSSQPGGSMGTQRTTSSGAANSPPPKRS
jgi:hypothetical protein